jgi:cell division protein FtsN
MAISLVEEDSKHFVPTAENQQILEKKSDEKEKYFGKTFLIIISTFIIVIVTIIFLVLRPNNKEIQQGAPAISQQNAPNEVQDSQADQNTVSRTQTKIESGSQQKNVSTTPVNDELSDFPISATPPVPIKNGPGDNSISVNKNLKQPANKQVPASTNSGSKSNLNETRIGKSIYTDGKSFNYQTSSWKNKQKAEQEVKRLRSMGLSANVLEVYLPQKGGTWYRVRVGSFKSQKEAENSMKQNNF